ncbi:hypothetical protein HPB50_004962 [Hyalomma asiaticum]|uniref:Uncharacterized protein n=1 Tax=Hyalomma asiaticum TaxID=266040 RepID=A0ACB7RUR3_HYAAI|nr:hypothetical protein HPB50_004962 [Hyalomma asiaticum]
MLVEACNLRRFSYHLPFHWLTQGQRERSDTLLRKIIKVALEVPHYTSTQHLLSLRVHNILGEVLEAQWISQHERLLPTGPHAWVTQFPLQLQECRILLCQSRQLKSFVCIPYRATCTPSVTPVISVHG